MSALDDLMKKDVWQLSPLEFCVWHAATAGDGASAEQAAAELAAQAAAIQAAREYRSVTSYLPAADGSCSQCDALGGDPSEHAEWCDYRKATTALDEALAKLPKE